jgi:hypothetical protein
MSVFVEIIALPHYHRSRTHLSLEGDAPEVRPVEAPERGAIVAIPQVAYAVQVPYYDYELW